MTTFVVTKNKTTENQLITTVLVTSTGFKPVTF